MRVDQFLNKITDNWGAKLICFVVALFLYLFHYFTNIEKKNFDIPLTVQSNGAVVMVNDIPSSVRVTVLGDKQDILTIQRNMIHASLNLNNYAESGSYETRISLSLADELVAMDPLEVRVKPEFITVDVEKKTVMPVIVNPVFAGTPAAGYEVVGFEIDNRYLEVYGADGIVRKTSSVVTETIDVTNLTGDKEFEVKVYSPNKMLTLSSPSKRKVTVRIKPQISEMYFNDITVNFASLKSNLMVENKFPSVSLKVTGNKNDVDKLKMTSFSVYVDLSEISEPGEYDLPLTYVLPSNITIIEKSDEFVHVKIILAPEETYEQNTENESGADESILTADAGFRV